MTGIGKAESSNDFIRIEMEIKSYNSRFFEFSPKSPKALSCYDDVLIKNLKDRLIRGKINVYTKIEFQNIDSELEVDKDRLNFYIDKSREINNILDSDDSLTLNQVMQLPDIFIYNHHLEKTKGVYLDCINRAIDDIIQARKMEGDNLKIEIKNYLLNIQEKVNNISGLIETNKDGKFTKYQAKVNDLLASLDIKFDKDRLYQEFALLLEKKDIEEEVVRLNSHLNLFDKYVESDKNVGKKLNFLLQEMNREVNTIGSKTDEIDISHKVIDIKSKIEQIKEQVQNIL